MSLSEYSLDTSEIVEDKFENFGGRYLWYPQEKIKESIKRLEENLIGLFDVYEIKVVNEGNEMVLREHEKRRMIKDEINKIFGDAFCTNSVVGDGK